MRRATALMATRRGAEHRARRRRSARRIPARSSASPADALARVGGSRCRRSPAAERRPAVDRGRVAAVPRPVPHLDEVGRLTQRQPPRAVPRPRVVHRHHPAVRRRPRPATRPAGSRKSIQPIAPKQLAWPVSVVTSWPGTRRIPAWSPAAARCGVVADRVVVGHGEQVETAARQRAPPARRPPASRRSARCGCGSRWPATRVRARPGGRAAAGAPDGRWRRRRRRGAVRRRRVDVDGHVDAARSDTIQAEDDLPRSGDLAGQVPGRRPLLA